MRSLKAKSLTVAACAAVGALCVAAAPAAKEQGPTLNVVITNVESDRGTVSVGLFNGKKGWPKAGHALKGLLVRAKKGVVRVQFKGLKPGRYAVALYHDANANGKLDKSFWGVPKEGYGFSRDAKGALGPPAFKEAAFDFRGGKQSVVSRVRY